MQRPVFQNGRVLRTSDFVEDQAYHLAAHREHNKALHVWGIASGLRIVRLDADLMVEPGNAVDGFGRDVVLDRARSLDLRGFDIKGIDTVDAWIVYAQSRTPGTGDGVDLLADAADIELTEARDIDPRQPPGVAPADLAAASTRPPPDNPARRWPVYLGRISRDLAHPETEPIIDLDRRPYIGLVGAAVETPERFVWLELTEGANPAVSITLPDGSGHGQTPLKISADDGIELNARLTVDGELVVSGGSVSVVPGAPALTAPAAAAPPEWSLSHAKDSVAHELRVAMPAAAAGHVPNRLVVGAWRDGNFARSLVIDETGTVLIAGNLTVSGRLQAASVQEAELGEAAKAYLAGLQATSLLALFGAVII